MAKVSIIVPIYNTETKLEKCLNSIVNQTVRDIEIVLVNDGSTDNSEKVAQKYVEKYPNIIKYYKKENEGLASARNYGIERATASYIMHVDSDDYIEKDTIEKLEKYIDDGIDLIKFKLKTIDLKGNVIKRFEGPIFESISGEEAFERLYGIDVMFVSACIYIMKKSLYVDELKFLGKYHEDFGLTPFLISTAKTVVSTPFYLYNYVLEGESITRTSNYNKIVERAKQTLYQYDQMLEKLKKIKLNKRTEENLKIYYTNGTILKANELQEKERKEFIKEIRKRKMYKNIKVRNLKQLLKKIILCVSTSMYLKLR